MVAGAAFHPIVSEQHATDRPEFYSVSEAAALLGVSRMTVWRWISAGTLRASRLGQRISRISREDLDRFLLARKGGYTPEPGSAPVPNWANTGHFDHFVQLYERELVMLDAVRGYLAPPCARARLPS
jgi:excisionase family DNA binding protein